MVAGGIGLAIEDGRLTAPAANEAPVRYGYGPKNFAAAVVRAELDVGVGAARVARRPGDWANQESLARALMGRARLTGSYDDLARADAALARAMADAPAGAGPLLSVATGSLTMHRLGPIGPALRVFAGAAVLPGADERSEAASTAGDLAFYSGDYAGAGAAYARAAAIADGPGVSVRRAIRLKALGDLAGASATLDHAMDARPTHRAHAMILLQRGGIALAEGDWVGAERLFVEADTVFPGYWLAAAHVAQMRALAGQLPDAERRYRAIIANMAVPDPMVIDALAALRLAQGDVAGAQVLAGQAGVIWQRRLGQLPEAAYAHVAEHELVLGDAARALDLAQRNYAARPYGDALLLLAMAQLANAQPAAAAKSIEALNRSGWQSAAQYAVYGTALALIGRTTESDAARQTALSINPHALDAANTLIWFGNH
jgi:tetratricopeptide (TPR) repeat protein